MNNPYQVIKEHVQSGTCILATVVEGIHTGEKLILSDGQISWSSPNEEFLPQNIEQIREIEKSQTIEIEKERVFCEKIGNRPVLVICGGGHVSLAIIKIAKSIGFKVVVLEDRPKFADWARSAGADQVICDSFSNGMQQIPGNKDTYFVIVTRGHRYDTECLREAVKKPNAYVGMMGSHKRVGIVKNQLAEEGVEKSVLDHIHTPIGLSIGAETPEEIAVSVMAEIIQVKNSERKVTGYEKELLSYLTGEIAPEKGKVLAVIVSKKGSAPRECGTKMLILEDGTTVGTIGGGCVESEIIREGLLMIRDHAPENKLLMVDMTGREAEEEGMVCGGTIEAYLEIV